MERKLILITNDDGVSAQGIEVLTNLMLQLGDVVVVAPDSARSGAACSITCTQAITLRRRADMEREGLSVYACSGSPVDCVKLGLEQCCSRQPDLLVSGINHGDNASCSIHYSGTMGAVLEGCMKGIPSIGYSLRTLKHKCDFQPYADHILRIARHVLYDGLPECQLPRGREVGRIACLSYGTRSMGTGMDFSKQSSRDECFLAHG